MTDATDTARLSGAPLFEGWDADPEIHIFDGRYYLTRCHTIVRRQPQMADKGKRKPDRTAPPSSSS